MIAHWITPQLDRSAIHINRTRGQEVAQTTRMDDGQFISLYIGPRAGASIGGDGGVDKPLVEGLQSLPAQTQAFEAAWMVVIDTNVSPCEKSLECVKTLCTIEIECHTSLAGIIIEEQSASLGVGPALGERACDTRCITLGRLYLDDIGSHVRKKLAAVWS
jgi:hypothetical protein